MKAAEAGIQSSSVVDEHGKSSAEASKNEKSKDAVNTHTNGVASSDKSKLCRFMSLGRQVERSLDTKRSMLLLHHVSFSTYVIRTLLLACLMVQYCSVCWRLLPSVGVCHTSRWAAQARR